MNVLGHCKITLLLFKVDYSKEKSYTDAQRPMVTESGVQTKFDRPYLNFNLRPHKRGASSLPLSYPTAMLYTMYFVRIRKVTYIISTLNIIKKLFFLNRSMIELCYYV